MENKTQENKYMLPFSIVIAGAMLAGAWMYNTKITSTGLGGSNLSKQTNSTQAVQKSELEEKVLPTEGVELPVTWGDLGKKLVSSGAIDKERFMALYEQREQFTGEYEKLLTESNDGKLIITEKNAPYLLNLFWSLGLSQDNPILTDRTEMGNPNYTRGGVVASGFASTGGWSMALGDPMSHYSRHRYFDLTPEQQALVDKVSRGIYRPCCNNSTHFPDCNHGMAMLGLLELMASQGANEQDMWRTALAVNSYWFPDTYLTLATYMKGKGVEWKDVNPQEILGINYSSGSGFARIASQVTVPSSSQSGSGCGVETSQPVPASRQQSGCGI